MRSVDDVDDESSSGESSGDESSCASIPTPRRKVWSAAQKRRVVRDSSDEEMDDNVDEY